MFGGKGIPKILPFGGKFISDYRLYIEKFIKI
jgi:hypothetical protein